MLLLFGIHLRDCYQSASIHYNYNLKIAQVELDSSLNPSCNQFGSEIKIRVSFHDNYDYIEYIFDAFDYEKTVKITMQNITIINKDSFVIKMPQFALINISNIAFWSTIRVSYLAKQISQMDQCFDQNGSNFNINITHFWFTVKITQACIWEISVLSNAFEYSFGQSANTIQIVHEYQDPINFNCHAINEVNNTLMECFQKGTFINDQQYPFIKPRVQFFMKQNGISFTSQIQFKNVIIGRVTNLFASISSQFFKDSLLITYKLTDDVNTLQKWKTLTQTANSIVYRLSIKTQFGIDSYKFEFASFDENLRTLIFQCDNEECIIKINLLGQLTETSLFQLDCTAFSGSRFITTVGQQFLAVHSCFQRVVIQIYSFQKVCFLFEKSIHYDQNALCSKIQDGEKVTIRAYSIQSKMLNTKFDQTINTSLKFQEPTVCFDCPECTKEILNFRNINEGIMIIISNLFQTTYVYGHQVQEMNYFIVKIFTLISGLAFILAIITDTIIKLILFQKMKKKFKVR